METNDRSPGQLTAELAESRRRETALHERLLALQQLLDALPIPVFHKDVSGRFTDCNAPFTEFMGLSRDGIAGRRIADLVSADLAGDHERVDAELLARPGRRVYEASMRRADGSRRVLVVNKATTTDASGRVSGIAGCIRDVTERRQVGEDLRAVQRQLETVLDFLPDPTFIIDESHRVVAWNRALERLAGTGAAQMIGKTGWAHAEPFYGTRRPLLADLVLQPDAAVEREYERFWRDGDSLHAEFPLPRLDKYVYAKASPIHGAAGRVTGAIESMRDLTAWKRTEAALRESERHLADVIDFLPDATLVIDREGRITAWNKAMEEMTGYPAARMIGKRHHEHAIPFYGERRPILIDVVLMPSHEVDEKYSFLERKGDLLIGETRVPVVRGQQRYLSGWAHPIFSTGGEVIGAIECIRDITDKHLALEALEENAARYRLLAENASDIIFTLDADLRLTYVSPSIERIRGFTQAEALGQRVEDVLAPGSVKAAISLFRDVLAVDARPGAPRVTRSIELEERCKDGSTVWLDTSVTSIHDVEERFTGVIGISRDVTERKRAEAERQRLEVQLAQARKMESIGTLAGGIAHDFNNILSAVFGFTELAKLKVAAGEDVETELSQVLNAATRARDLVKQILTFSRKTGIQREPIELAPLVRETLKLIRASLPATVEIRTDLCAASSTVLADPTQVHQVLMNLCTNAAHAMREKGGVLDVRLAERDVRDEVAPEYQALASGRYMMLSVADTGPGIPPDIIDQVFDPFFTTKPRGEGTGMGLSVVHGIVKDMRGAITVHSEPGHGAIFEVLLPRHEATAPARAAEPSPAPPRPTGGRVLLVDDEESVIESGRGILRQFGYEVVSTTSPLEALEIFKADPARFHCVLTDMTMPRMTGVVLAERLKELRPDIPVVLCTGFSLGLTEERIRRAGISEMVMKPIIASRLVEAVQTAIAGRAPEA